jgi:hypothetical protein
MLFESELQDLIDIGRRILHEGCEQKLCDMWRHRCFQLLSKLLGPQHEYIALFQGNECCDVKSLLVRVKLLCAVRDLLDRRELPLGRDESH